MPSLGKGWTLFQVACGSPAICLTDSPFLLGPSLVAILKLLTTALCCSGEGELVNLKLVFKGRAGHTQDGVKSYEVCAYVCV